MFFTETTDNYQMLHSLDLYMIGHKGFICGGCFKDIFNGKKAKDLDIFFETEEDFKNAVKYYESKKDEYAPAYTNKNVVALINKLTGVRIELCRRIFGKPREILEQFDFTITKVAYYKETIMGIDGDNEVVYQVVMHKRFFEHLHLNRLVTDDKIMFPMSTFERILRYAKYGFFPCRETKMKIAGAIKGLSDQQIQVSESLYDGMD